MDSTHISDPRIGSLLQGRYRILERLAAGGMGVVYRGERVELGRAVAIKFLHPWVAADASFQRRFQIEAQAMSRLSHPCCVSVIDFGVEGNAPYMVMDFVTGETVRALQQDGPLPTGRALGIVRQVLAGLSHAHSHSIVHRDIKPDNIICNEVTGLGDQVRILDFGLAKLRDAVSGLTTGLVVGTPSYMAPEQVMGEEVDARTDIYTTGVLLFELLTGCKPFSGEQMGDVMRQHREATPPRLIVTAPGGHYSEAMEAVVARALAKRKDQRFQSAAEFIAALDATPEVSGGLAQRAATPVPASRVGSATDVQPLSTPTSPVPALTPTTPIRLKAQHTVPGRVGASPSGELPDVPPTPGAVESPGPAPVPSARGAAASEEEPEALDATSVSLRQLPPAPEAPSTAAPGAVVPTLVVPKSTRPRSKWLVPALGAGGVLLAGAVALVSLRGGEEPAKTATPAGSSAPAAPAAQESETAPEPEQPPPDTEEANAGQPEGVPPEDLPNIEQIRRLVKAGRRDSALRALANLRKQYPKSAYAPYLEGQVNFDNLRWLDGLESYKAAIQNNEAYRSDPTLIRNVIRCLVSDRFHYRCADFLVRGVGAPAAPYLEEAARTSPYANVQNRATRLIPKVSAQK